MTTTDPSRIVGYCPMGCGRTLFSAQGCITCSFANCPRPTAVDELLDDRETQHIVDFGESEFTVRHPLRERLDDALLDCDLHRYCNSLPGPPTRPGRYRARQSGLHWTWEPVNPAPVPGLSPDTADRTET
jgi:hypothetical protein